MGIFNLIFRNSGQKARTIQPTAITLPQGYRGALKHDLDQCIGCHTCAYVCSPGAITVQADSGGMLWRYLAVRCTFCARCAEYCPTGAIRLEAEATAGSPALLSNARPDLDTQHHIDAQPCARCGQPFLPMPAPILAHLTGRDIDGSAADLPNLMRLCEKCRQRVTAQRFKESLHPTGGK